MTLLRLNQMGAAAARAAYAQVVPPRAWAHLGEVAAELAGGSGNPAAFRVIAGVAGSGVHLRAPAERVGRDYALALDLDEGGAGQLELGFVVINDLAAPRFDIDVDEAGRPTLLGAAGRNLKAEAAALAAGLGPGQVRRGLRLLGELLPRLERLAARLGYVAITVEPLNYHTAILYEYHGFGYLVGHQRMQRIDQAFRPGGALAAALDGSSPFRRPDQAGSVRGRSWAIHDGALTALDAEPALSLRMVKVIGRRANQRTFAG